MPDIIHQPPIHIHNLSRHERFCIESGEADWFTHQAIIADFWQS